MSIYELIKFIEDRFLCAIVCTGKAKIAAKNNKVEITYKYIDLRIYYTDDNDNDFCDSTDLPNIKER